MECLNNLTVSVGRRWTVLPRGRHDPTTPPFGAHVDDWTPLFLDSERARTTEFRIDHKRAYEQLRLWVTKVCPKILDLPKMAPSPFALRSTWLNQRLGPMRIANG